MAHIRADYRYPSDCSLQDGKRAGFVTGGHNKEISFLKNWSHPMVWQEAVETDAVRKA